MTKNVQTEEMVEIDGMTFPPFDLERLLSTVFELNPGERFAVFTDLADPTAVKEFAYLNGDCLESQAMAHDVLYEGLKELKEKLGFETVDFYAYEETGGPNLDLPDTVYSPDGEAHPTEEAFGRYSIVLCTGRWSATAPVTALAKELQIRGATMHGLNETVLKTGLAVDYDQVSARAERLRSAITGAETITFFFTVDEEDLELEIQLNGQEAQKSHGLVHTLGDVANLPAGEVYFVPEGAEGHLPYQFEDEEETIAIFTVQNRGVTGLHRLVRGSRDTVEEFLERVANDENAGQLTELGLGTQTLPFAGCDIQDEKVLGTAHVATGRSDHLGGDIDSSSFKDKRNAVHNDILWAPHKTPEIKLNRVDMNKEGGITTLIRDYGPTEFLASLK